MLKKMPCRHSIYSLLLTLITQAAWSTEETSSLFPRIGRVALSAAGAGVGPAADGGIGIFGGDVMQPVYGNDNGFLFADFMGDGATGNTSLLSPGVGYRQVIKNQIWGAYFFGDNEKVNLGKHFWNLSPGIEWMSPHWDMHANGYFPIPKTEKMGAPVFADTLGNYDYVYFVDGTHNQYDALTAPYDVIGNGGDVEIGFRFASHNNLASRVYVGGYYYQPSSDNNFIPIPNIKNVKNITGITAGFEQSLNKILRISFMNSYDSVSLYTIGIGVKLTFGDESTLYSDNVHDRLLEPIERHVGIIGTGAGTYDQLGYRNLGSGLEYNNVYFISPNGTGNGTYGSPMALTQTSLDTINSESPLGSRLYLQGGDPPIYEVNTTTAGTYSGLLLYNGEDLYGRSANYTAPAANNERPIILVDGTTGGGVNGFIINGGENTFDDLTIMASSTNGTTVGIDVITSTDATVNVVNTSITGLNRGLYAENDSTENLTINASNSKFNDNTYSPVSPSDPNGAYGIYAYNVSAGTLSINATNSSFNGNTINGGNNGNQAYGIYASNGAGNLIINAINSFFNSNANSGTSNNGAAGISAGNGTGNLTINTTNSSFNGNTNTGSGGGASGISATNNDTGNITINASNSQFNENSSTNLISGAPQVNGLYVYGLGNVNLNFTNSSFNGNTITGPTNGGVYGVFLNVANLNMNVTNSTFNGNINDSQNTGNGSLACGIEAAFSGTASINVSHSQFNGNQSLNGGTGNQAIGFLVIDESTANVEVNVSGSQFNDTVSTGDGNAGAIGFNAINVSNNPMNINITSSQFNRSTASGANNGGAYGFYVDNSAGTGALSVTSLLGSVFGNNGTYGLFVAGNATLPPNTTVTLAGTTFFGNPTNVESSGNVTITE